MRAFIAPVRRFAYCFYATDRVHGEAALVFIEALRRSRGRREKPPHRNPPFGIGP